MERQGFTPALEADYLTDLGPWKIKLSRQVCVLGAVLYASHSIVDRWALPTHVYAAWGLRALMVASLVVALILTGRRTRRFFLRHYSAIVGAEFVILGLGLQGLICLASPAEPARIIYPAGFALLLIPLYTWTFLRPAVSMTIGAFLIAMYVMVAAFFLDGLAPDLRPFLLSNIMIIASALFVGLVSRELRDRLARSNYLLKHALQRDLELKEEARQQSEHIADHDQLTGLHNRKYFERHLTEVIPRLQRGKRAMAVLFIDLDDFKPVNDSHGHETGDRVLQVVAERLRSCVRSDDITARLGGDEFVVAMELPIDGASLATEIAEEIAERISAAIDGGGTEIRLTASVGIALHPFHGADASTVVAAADSQMYKAKRQGKHGVRMAPLPVRF